MKKKNVQLDGPSEVQVALDDNETEIVVGSQSVTIEKLFGPAIFSSIRVTPVVDKDWYWRIEMENNATGKFEEMMKLRHEISYEEDQE